jgi:spore coat protein A
MLSRRDLIKLGALAAPAIITSRTRAATAFLWSENDPSSPASVPFQINLPIPPVLQKVNPDTLPGVQRFSDATDYYSITMRQAPKQVFQSGPPTNIWGYNGIWPGPTIVAQRNRRVVVRQTNHLNVSNTAVVHLHGGHTPSISDGGAFTSQFVLPGRRKDYVYPNNAIGGATLWYHDHFTDFSGRNDFMGLAGFYLLKDEFETNLEAQGVLPRDAFDISLVLQDRRFNANNQLDYNPFDHDGVLGDKFMVNGAIQPKLRVANRRYRFRVLNGSNARYYNLSVQTGNHRQIPFTIIASDQGLLPRPVETTNITMAPAERYEVIVDFSQFSLGSQLFLNNCLEQKNGRGPDQINPDACVPLVRFDVDVDSPESNPKPIPDPLRTDIPILLEKDAVRTREWEFNRSDGAWQVNGKFYDENRVDARPVLNTTEIWRFKNGGGGWFHPIHTHDEAFRILDRDGSPPPTYEAGLKDVVNLNPGEEVRVILQFRDYLGKYVMHCHNIEHEDMRMMVRFDVVAR